jgi:hypothetical protein
MGFLATGSTAYALGEVVVLSAGSTLEPSQVARATTTRGLVIGVCAENLDAVKAATGKAHISIQLEGIAKVIASAAIAQGAYVANSGTVAARAMSAAQVAGGSVPLPVFGIALTAAAANGDIIDVLLTPGALA